MNEVFLSSDFHLGHANIIKYSGRVLFMSEDERRQYSSLGDGQKHPEFKISNQSVERHDAAIIDSVNECVGVSDTLYFLGDFCFSPRQIYEQVASKYRRRIKCRNIILIWGNHDKHPLKNLFVDNYNLVSLYIKGQKVVLCHYPLAIWDGKHYGSWHFAGHSHSRAEAWLDQIMPGRYSMDVGINNAFCLTGRYRPFSFDEISKIFAKRPGFGLIREGDLKGEGEFKTSV